MATVHVPSRAIPALSIRKRLVALFGILALFSMMALTIWHDALPHIDDVEQAQSMAADHHGRGPNHHDADHHETGHHDHASGHHHDDDADDQPDSGKLIHVAAHVALQTIDLPAPPIMAGAVALVAPLWSMAPVDRIDSVKPDSLLRPPRG